MFEATEGPFGYAVRDGARDVQGCESMETLDATVGRVAYACDAGSVTASVGVVNLLDR